MNGLPKTDRARTHARRALWASLAFYALIAFEFFYMASPFGVYFYAVYGPGLDWLEGAGSTRWIIQFFLPHLVEETRSFPVNVHATIGMALFSTGLAGFALGVVQIYRAKLRQDDAVMGGLYRFIRHPQYLALIISSIGMVLIWPRFLVVLGTVTVIFVYIALAKAEEGICLRQYPGYGAYMKRTGMFLPAWIEPKISGYFGKSRWVQFASWALIYCVVTGASLALAYGMRLHAMNSLYTLKTEEGVFLSVAEISDADLAALADIARASPDVAAAIAGQEHLIGYVLPENMYVSEIPMYLPPGEAFGHDVPSNSAPGHYKIIFTSALFGPDGLPKGGDILWHAVNKTPLLEARVDLAKAAVTAVLAPPETPYYDNRQVPLF